MTEKGIDFDTINYNEQRLSAEELQRLLQVAGLKPHDALRRNEPAYREHVAGKHLDDEQLIRVMANYPELIQRPIVVRGDRAVLARPLDQLTALGIEWASPKQNSS